MTVIESKVSQEELETLYYGYTRALDDEIAYWPDFFTDNCTYKVVTRENYARNLPLALMLCEGKGMVIDRVDAIKGNLFYKPRFFRHMVSNILVDKNSDDVIHAQANFVIFESFSESTLHVFNAGRYLDVIVRDNMKLKFREKTCVLDGSLIPGPGSFIFPV